MELCKAVVMRLITEHQLGRRLGDFLQNGLNSEAASFRGAVAFLRASGMAHLKPLISNFSSTRSFELIVGVDLKGTTVEGLTMLKDSLHQHGRAFIFHNSGSSTFHPKLFYFRYPESTDLYVGSGNFTAGGLFTNHESGLVLTLGRGETESGLLAQVDDSLDRWSIKAGASSRLLDQTLIDELVNCGLVVTEAQARAAFSRNQASQASKPSTAPHGAPLFGALSVPSAPVPLVAVPSSKPTSPIVEVAGAKTVPAAATSAMIPAGESNQTFWIETKSMTGGSRNILDLSMRSLLSSGDPNGTPFDIGIPGFICGSVAFFGLNPADTKAFKDVTLVFDGLDYSGNRILFPEGSHANGTWRLQIKGSNSSGHKITDTFREKEQGYYLVQKIAVFKKKGRDRYDLSVVEASQLARFKAASKILAFNGNTRNAKQIGFF